MRNCKKCGREILYGEFCDRCKPYIKGARMVVTKIKNEISLMKSNQKSSNTDFVTGYISALSALEGCIAEIESEDIKVCRKGDNNEC